MGAPHGWQIHGSASSQQTPVQRKADQCQHQQPRLMQSEQHPSDWDLGPLPSHLPPPSDLTNTTLASPLTRAW